MTLGWHRDFLRPEYWPVADWEYTPERTARELAYLARRLPGQGTIVDAGCGLGRHAIGLARPGRPVIGVDCRQDALREARRRAALAGARTVRFACADLFAGPPLREGSAAAAICLQSFGWGSEDDQRALLAGLGRMLAPGGLLILDVTNPVAIFASYQPSATAEINGETYRFDRCYDVASGRSRGSIAADGMTGGPVRHDIRLYTAPEVRRLLAEAGFEVETLDADFTIAGPARMNARYLQYAARRRAPVTAGPRHGPPPARREQAAGDRAAAPAGSHGAVQVKVLTAAAELAACGWDDGLLGPGDFYLSSTWLKVLENISSVRPFYLIACDDRGRSRAGLTAYLMTKDAPAWDFYRLDRVLKRLAALPDRDAHGIAGVRGREPHVVMPHLLLGGRHTAHARLLLARGLSAAGQREASDAVLAAAESLGRETGARALAFMFVDEDDPLRARLAAHGYLEFMHATAGVMDIDFATFGDYLRRFSAHRRKRIKRELRDFAAAGVVFSHHPLGEVIEEITPLGMALEARYGAEGDTVATFQASLRVVSDALGERAVALTAEQGGKIRAHLVTMRWDDHLILRSAGFDYEFKGRLPLYYGLAFYHVVEYALTTGVRQVSYSIESTAAKRSRGCRLIDEYGMARGLDDEAAGALRQVLASGRAVTGS